MNGADRKLDEAGVRSLVAKFEGVRKQHPHFEAAYSRALALTSVGHASRVVIITGPTGVGKSTLGGSIRKKALLNAAAECQADPSLVPAVLVTATPPHGRSFNWKDFYVRTLEQLNEPLIERKVYPGQMAMFEAAPGMKSIGESLSTDPLRRQIEKAFRHRKTRLWIIDEAHHILMCHDPKHLEFQFETLKSLADLCDATLVLLGTYKLLEIRDHSAQLMRRSQIVHFPSYRLEQKEDRVAFKSTLDALAKALPIPLEEGLFKQVDYFFNKTAGCVGILRDLLRDALEDAAQAGAASINVETLDRSAQSNKAIIRILEESAAGCLALEDVGADTVEQLVRMPPQALVDRLHEMRRPRVVDDGPGRAPRPAGARADKRIGERLPVRDKVGGAGRVSMP